jgi:hypothetical protein
MKKSFKSRVISLLKRDRWQIEEVSDSSVIDFIAFHSKRVRKAYKVKAHRHLLKAEVKALREYGRTHNMGVLYVHEQEDHELRFERLYPMCEKWTKQT